MTVTRHAREAARARAEKEVRAQKDEYRDKIRRIQEAFHPPLTNAELSVGLDLDDADAATAATVGRFVSESPQLARARPDTATRALIDAILDGDLLVAVADGVPGARRQVVVGDARDFRRLGRTYTLKNLAGLALPERRTRPADWDDGERWNLFGDGGTDAKPAGRGTIAGFVVPRRICGRDVHPVGFGAMRLSTDFPAGSGETPESVLHAYLDAALASAPAALVDTADVYGPGEDGVGHGEELIRRVLDGRDDADRVLVATKAGLARPGGKWRPDGRPEHLRRAVEASLGRLGGGALELLQLHVVDSRVPLEESVGELARLRDEGKVRHVGLSNVGVEELDEAREIVEIDSVQVAASVFERKPFAPGGLVERCHELGIALVAHSPLGGHRRKDRAGRERTLSRIAEELRDAGRDADPWHVALAWLLHMGPGILPIAGATTVEHAESNPGAAEIVLGEADLVACGAKKEARRRTWSVACPPKQAVLILGPPAAGKTSRVDAYVARGYRRLNRDEEGGRLAGLEKIMRRELDQGRRAFVLDNTYPTRESRRGVIDLAKENGLEVVALHVDVPLGEALYNACLRMLERHGKILAPEEIKALGRRDPNMLPPGAIYRYFGRREEPTTAEGFDRVETLGFERRRAEDQVHKALLLDVDGTLRKTRSGAPFPSDPDDVELLPGRREILDRHAEEGWLLFGVSNQSAIGKGRLDEEQAEACFERTRELLGRHLEILYCPHPATSAGAWSRKPMPGMAVELIERHRLDRDRCLVVGDLESDREFAELSGIEFRWAEEFFAG